MRIEASETGNIQLYKTSATLHAEIKEAEYAAGKQYDRVDIMQDNSGETDFRRTLVSKLVQETRAANSISNIQQLKEQVRNDSYTIDADHIAAAMLLEKDV